MEYRLIMMRMSPKMKRSPALLSWVSNLAVTMKPLPSNHPYNPKKTPPSNILLFHAMSSMKGTYSNPDKFAAVFDALPPLPPFLLVWI